MCNVANEVGYVFCKQNMISFSDFWLHISHRGMRMISLSSESLSNRRNGGLQATVYNYNLFDTAQFSPGIS